jgi:hypothetical protein
MDPIHLYEISDPKHTFMMEQVRSPLYFVVASAYDYAALARHERRLLWRTRLTVDCTGVSPAEAIPLLISSASPWFGKDMAEPQLLTKRLKQPVVRVGTPEVVHDPDHSSR